ncbi:SCO7613 C-terminal domain-containing membrane protein [Streptomyces sp. NPDC087300]|uniref:SCO7613 C-terminal domain-containing membrane protein n=1 Tax=Streptomyces sp. NPDC087300 TaxID=3365780 RepID=UPI003819C24B
MTNLPPPAEELRILDWELRQLEARRTQLLRRRAWLLGALRAAGPAGQPPHPAGPPAPEAAPPSVQNVLLALGGVLLTIAAIAFTVVSWGHLGIGGRSAVLGAVTLTALGVPAVLLRRKLRSTAETVAALAMALTVLDAYALRHLALPDVDALGFAAVTSALLASVWAGYGLLLGGLRLPLPTAVATAQLPLVLWAGAAGAGEHTMTAALLVTAAFDTALALWAAARSVRLTATAGACVLGLWGAASAGWLSAQATDPAGAARAGALLLFAAAIALVAAWRSTLAEAATGAACAAGLLVVAATGGVPRTALPAVWTVPVHLACGIALLAVLRGTLPDPLRRGIAGASAVVQGIAVLWALPVAALALLGPVGWATRAWSGAPADARDALLVELPTAHPLLAPLVLGSVAAVCALAAGRIGGTGQRTARYGALALTWSAALAVPPALALPYAAGVSVHLLVTAAALALAVRSKSAVTALAASVLALASSASVAFLALATTSATLGTLAFLTAAFLIACVGLARRAEPAPGAAALSVCATLTHTTALVCAVGAALALRPEHTGLLALAVPALAALVAARMGRHPLALPVEIMGAASGALAVTLTAPDAPTLALALGLGGLIASGTALRADRHPVGYAAAALLVLASWVRLAAWDVSTPEAYALPVTVPALLIGVLRRRRDPELSSWAAYGPGLAATLLPSLAAAWGDPHWQRPLLLGVGALTVTLVGARHRLRAPLVIGGAVLALDALHELAPYLVQAVGVLPRWLPPALAGLLLLALGATYEQRLRDARRFRNVLNRMH